MTLALGNCKAISISQTAIHTHVNKNIFKYINIYLPEEQHQSIISLGSCNGTLKLQPQVRFNK